MICHRIALPFVAIALAGGLPAQAQFLAPTRPPMPADNAPEFKLAVGDVDGDGFPDLVCANMGGTMPGTQNTLYLNDRAGGFVDVTATHLPQVVDWSGAVALGDVDGDGDLDIFFGNQASQPSTLYQNDGTGRFTDVTGAQLPFLARTIYCAKFVDIDGDRDLDLVARERILQNDGRGFFTDVTSTHSPNASINAWGMAVGDVDGDGDQDVLFGINSTTVAPVLWLNNGLGVFTDAGANLPGPIYVAGDFTLADIDWDGDLDVFLQSYARPSQLWRNNGQGVFTNVSATQIPAIQEFTYSSAMADMDGDGDPDIVLFNGANVAGQTRLLRNDGTGVFVDAPGAVAPAIMNSTCGALADLDRDGDLDIVFGNWNAQNAVWLNLHRQGHAPQAPMIGATWTVDWYSRPGYGPSVAVLPFLSVQPPTPLTAFPPYGFSLVPPASAVVGALGITGAASGHHAMTVAVPNNPGLVGLALLLQGLVVEDAWTLRLTNTLVDRVR